MSEKMTRERLKKSMTIDDALNVLRDTNAYGTMDIAKSVILDYFAALSAKPSCKTCKHYTAGEYDGSCGSYICKDMSDWEDQA